MNIKSTVVVASLVMLAGCTSEGGDEPEPKVEEQTTTLAAPEAVDGAPIEFELETPEGFTLASDEERPDLMAENHLSYVFALDGGGPGDRVMVTSYVLDQTVPAGDFDALLAVVSAYDEQRGQASEAERYLPALVNRMPGVHRYIEIGEDAAVKQYNHYLAVDSHLIQITCQWERDYTSVMAACEQLEQDFPVPNGWSAAVS